ncbi:MAG TPA: MFS transporter [Candidatus Limnocylindrales bacterium]|jgi:MFS family permease|nr:MFS transporter [Candidatus Limnocylindrales bacterium]
MATIPEQTVSAREPEAVFPPGLHNAYLFSTFNAFSYQIVLNSPMVLYAKTLGASATVVGIIAGMMPLLVIFQIPAASYIPRVGFKRFVYAGWGTRVMFIFAMALVPLTAVFLKAETRLALMLLLLFCFNLSRGISSCAWLPWITALVPATLRGKYLARDAAVQNMGSFLTFLVAAGCLAGESHSWQFAVLFAFSAINGAISLTFLKRIPDAEISEEVRKSKGPVPWLEMISYAPFKKLLFALVGYSVGYGGITAFTVAFLKSEIGMSETNILLVTAISFLGGLSSLWLLGSRLDRLGSKPVLSFCFMLWVAVLAGWVALSGGALPVRMSLVWLLELLMGLLAALVQMSNTRLAMAVIPVMGRNHFFAIYSVVGNVTLGLAPIAWGLLIDAVGSHAPYWLGLSWNRYTVFFAAAGIAYLITLALARRLEEPEAASMEELLREILIQSPQRFWLRFWPRGGT